MDQLTISSAVALSANDGEFTLYAKSAPGTFALRTGTETFRFRIEDGRLFGPLETNDQSVEAVTISGDDEAWEKLLTQIPPAPFTDFFSASRSQAMRVEPEIDAAPMHNALRRFCQLLRHAHNGTDPTPVPLPNRDRHGEHDEAVGRYVHLTLDGVDHRLYYEQAGTGVPLICHHTAGADARQWRHIFEDPRITSRFRVIAYDLPYHARSLPPESTPWWATEYRMTTAKAMAIPVALSQVLGLDRPIFMGSSLGGMLALDLACHHPDEFRAVIGLECGLRASGGSTPEETERSLRLRERTRLADPAIHGAAMMRNTAPTAPEAYRQETMLHYSQGAPGVFTGDLYYHAADHDLRDKASSMDTARCPVYLLTGEYDYTMIPVTERAGREIPGASMQIMKGLGHFPMSEDYERLMTYVYPILDEIVAKTA